MRDCARSQISSAVEGHARGVGSEFWSGQRLACDARTSASTKCRLEADLGVAATWKCITAGHLSCDDLRDRSRRWTNAVTIGWLIAERMGVHCPLTIP